MTIPVLDGITAHTIETPRLKTRVLTSGDDDGVPVLFLHGNLSNATWWESTMLALPDGFRGIAPDQRGYGDADPDAKIDATRGMGDLADDAIALLDHLNIEKAHLVGHSLGGNVVWWLMRKHPERILTVTQVSTGSPYGFGATKDIYGTPTAPDFAGSGGGLINSILIQTLSANDRSTDSPFSPRNVLRTGIVKPPLVLDREDDILSGMLVTHIGEDAYPGDKTESPHWPHVAPGDWGPNNALSPKYAGDVTELYRIEPKPDVLWIRGAEDKAVADAAASDVGTLGMMGFIPGYPGKDVYPPQPMISQIRTVLDAYQEAGGSYQEVVIEDCAHAPYLEKPDIFNATFHAHLTA